MLTRPETGELLKSMRTAAETAGAMALDWFRAGEKTLARIDWKGGSSPVSEADFAVDNYLREQLGRLMPEAGWLSEETADSPDRLGRPLVFIVDPIDGTRAFISGDPRWAVSAALVEDGRPVAAVLHMPAAGLTFEARSGEGATLNGLPIRASNRDRLAGARIAGPPRLMDNLERGGVDFEREPKIPSLAYRLARVGAGELDAGIASTNAWDWDIAAADLIVREAGGLLTDLDEREPIYNRANPRHGILGAAPARLHGELIAALREAAKAPRP
ncbi:MAG: 3'(2'),5'-bisphosphate nucleotidase CysQ [Beijerinckiaceae bacterium]